MNSRAELIERAKQRLSDVCECGHSIPDDHFHGECEIEECKCELPDLLEQVVLDEHLIKDLVSALENCNA